MILLHNLILLCQKCLGKFYTLLWKLQIKLQQIASNNSLDVDFKDFMNFYENCTVIIMTVDGKIRDEKLQYDINREVAKISALSEKNG